MFRMPAHVLTNPIIASWITAFIRSILAEMLHNIDKHLRGKAVSVTTDGFITNLADLEELLLSLGDSENTFLRAYRALREELTRVPNEEGKEGSYTPGNPTALEIKTEGVGVISWTTRGQAGIGSGIIATTGLQRKNYNLYNPLDKEEFIGLLEKTMNHDSHELEYIQRSLRSAKDISLRGGHVTSVYRDQIFRMQYDHRRKLHDESVEGLFDSSPVLNVLEANQLRYFNSRHRTKIYNLTSHSGGFSKYRKYSEIPYRTFVKLVLANSPLLPGVSKVLNTYSKLIDFISGFDSKYRSRPVVLAMLKYRTNVMPKQIPVTENSLKFLEFVKAAYPSSNFEVMYAKG